MYDRKKIIDKLKERSAEHVDLAERADEAQVREHRRRYPDVDARKAHADESWQALVKLRRTGRHNEIAAAASTFASASRELHYATVKITPTHGNVNRQKVAAIANVVGILEASDDVQVSGSQLDKMGALTLLKRA